MSDPTDLGERFGFQRAVEKLRGEEVLGVLVAHQRRDIGSCLCGWAEYGHRHSRHVADRLVDWLEAEAKDIYRGSVTDE